MGKRTEVPRGGASGFREAGRLALGLAWVAAGCSGGGGEQPWPTRIPPAPRVAKSSKPEPEPPPAPPPLELERSRPDPEAEKAFRASLAEGLKARDLEPASDPPKVTALALENTARGEAAGMRSDGSIRAAELGEGGRATVALRLARGRCLTVIAQGGLGAAEVDLFLTSGEGRGRRVVARDARTGPIAVIGGRAGCFRVPAGGLYELHALLRRGEGPVLVRTYAEDAPDEGRGEPPARSAPASSEAPGKRPSR